MSRHEGEGRRRPTAHERLMTDLPNDAADEAADTITPDVGADATERIDVPATAETAESVETTDTVETGTPTLAAADKAPVVVPFSQVPAAGKHTVAWRTMSADGHVVRGTFVFTVRSAAP